MLSRRKLFINFIGNYVELKLVLTNIIPFYYATIFLQIIFLSMHILARMNVIRFHLYETRWATRSME